MSTIRTRGARASAAGVATVPLRLLLARLDQDQADLDRARALLAEGERLQHSDPREAFELVHRAALRGAGVIAARANRARRRRLPLNVWDALARLGGADADRAEQAAPMVAERERLDRAPGARPDPQLLKEHLRLTAAHLEQIAARLVEELPVPLAELTAE